MAEKLEALLSELEERGAPVRVQHGDGLVEVRFPSGGTALYDLALTDVAGWATVGALMEDMEAPTVGRFPQRGWGARDYWANWSEDESVTVAAGRAWLAAHQTEAADEPSG